MRMFTIIVAVIVSIPILILVLAAVAGFVDRLLHPHGHKVSPDLVRKQLQKIVDETDRYALDDFISGGAFKEPRLEAIRKRVAQLDEEFPPESKGEYCSPKGIEVIRGYIEQLHRD